jgi:glycosyltransferase involved in cell wall biosynthesis
MTVAICTWNRAPLLRQTLEEMTKLAVPADVWWELLVVNNNCTDATDAVIAEFSARLPIRRLFQPEPGLSNARNMAVAEARGDYIVWTDDDVLVAPDWLTEYARAFARWPDAVAFGGPIAPWFPNTPPPWLERAWPRVANAYASIDYGATAQPLADGLVPFGANMAMRMDAQRAALFDPARGVRPGSRMGGEETDVVRRMLRQGMTGWWVPTARVRHYIPVERQTRAYLRGWYRSYGEYLGRYGGESDAAMLLGRPRWLWRSAVLSELRYRVLGPLRPPTAWIEDLIEASTAWGQLRGYRQGGESR